MFLRGGSSRNNIAMEESLTTRSRYDSVRSLNPNDSHDIRDGDERNDDDGCFHRAASTSPPCEEAPPITTTTNSRTSGGSNGQQRFFRRHGSQPTLRWLGGGGNGNGAAAQSNNNKSKRRLVVAATPNTPKSTANQSLSMSITSHTSTSPTSYSHHSSSLVSPVGGGGGGILGHQRGLLSSMSPAKKKPSNHVVSSGDNSNSNDPMDVPRIIVAGPSPPLVAAVNGGGGVVNNNSSSTSGSRTNTGTPSSPRRAGGAAASSRPQIYVPHLNDTVSTFDSNNKKGTTTTTGTGTSAPSPMLSPPLPAPMDYCHHVPSSPAPSKSPRRNPKTSTCSPYVVTGQPMSGTGANAAPLVPTTSLPRRLPSDDDWTPNSGTPRHDQYQRHQETTKRSDNSNDEDTDIHDGDTDIHDYDDDDDEDGRSASVCDTLHNSLGTDSFRLPKPSAASSVSVSVSVSAVSGVFCCEDSYHNYSSSMGTESFRLPNPYSVCDESLHNSSSMGTDSHRRRRRFDRAMSDDDNVMDEYETHRYDSYRDVHDSQQEERHNTGSTPAARVVNDEAKVADVEEDSKRGGTASLDSDDQSLSPEDVVEVPSHRFPPTRPVQEPAPRASNGASSAPSHPSSSRDGAVTHSPPRGSAAAAAKSPSSSEALSASSIIEIFPGCKVPLRGSRETWGSFRDGTAVLVPCTACLNCVYCVPDVTMVLCPHCRDISPLATTVDNLNAEASVGLGMSVHESRSMMGA